jgi:hypothetical protein
MRQEGELSQCSGKNGGLSLAKPRTYFASRLRRSRARKMGVHHKGTNLLRQGFEGQETPRRSGASLAKPLTYFAEASYYVRPTYFLLRTIATSKDRSKDMSKVERTQRGQWMITNICRRHVPSALCNHLLGTSVSSRHEESRTVSRAGPEGSRHCSAPFAGWA